MLESEPAGVMSVANGAPALVPTPPRHSVLVVDDNEDVCKSMTRILLHLGFNSRYVASGLEALRTIQEHPPDLVILDVMMPGMDGMQVLNHLKSDARTHALPVVMFTAIVDEEFRRQAIQQGAVDYWVKAGINFGELRSMVHAILNRAKPN